MYTSYPFASTASQAMTLAHLSPFMIGDLVPGDDEHWDCFLTLWDICSIACAYEIAVADAAHLAWLVQIYLESFAQLYTVVSVPPKVHFLIHLPSKY